jgi:hypothetical protein
MLNVGYVYFAEVFCGSCEDVVVFMQEADEVVLSLAIE